jgi:hypothetical protein
LESPLPFFQRKGAKTLSAGSARKPGPARGKFPDFPLCITNKENLRRETQTRFRKSSHAAKILLVSNTERKMKYRFFPGKEESA